MVKDKIYLDEVCKLKDYDDYEGMVFSNYSDNLVTKVEYENEILKMLKEKSEAPIVAIAENGERLRTEGAYHRAISLAFSYED